MTDRDRYVDCSRDGSGQQQRKDVGAEMHPVPATLWEQKKADRRAGKIGSGTRGAADTRAAGDA